MGGRDRGWAPVLVTQNWGYSLLSFMYGMVYGLPFVAHSQASWNACLHRIKPKAGTSQALGAAVWSSLPHKPVHMLATVHAQISELRILRTDVEFPSSPSNWKDIVPEHSKDVLNWAAALKVLF